VQGEGWRAWGFRVGEGREPKRVRAMVEGVKGYSTYLYLLYLGQLFRSLKSNFLWVIFLAKNY